MKANRRGMVLVTVMFFILIVGLFGRAMLINGPAMAQVANQSHTELQAQRAAEAGAAYARLKIRENGDWKGDDNAVTVNTADLKIEERDGSVIGWLKGANSEVSMFRIRFNYHDGSGGGDSMPDPPAAFRINNTYLSLNNVRENSDTVVPDVDSGSYSVPDPDVGALTAPSGSAFLRIEGMAGTALHGTSGPGDSPASGGRLTSRVLRVVYKAAPQLAIPDTALSAGNGIELEVETGANVSIIGAGEAKLRSKKGVTVELPLGGDSLLTMNGTVGRDPSDGLNALMDSANVITEVDESVGDGNDFFNLKWEDVPKASTDVSEAVQLPGGIYVATNTGEYLYYDMDLAAFEALTPDPTTGIRPPTQTLSSNFSEVRPPGNMSVGGVSVSSDVPYVLTFNKDVNFFESPGGQNDVLFTTVGGRRLHKNDTESPYEFSGVLDLFNSPGTMVIDNAIMSSPGDLGVMVDVVGENASLTSEGNSIIAAPSVALLQDEAIEFDQRLSLYSKGDLTISTYRNSPGYPPYVPPYEGYNNLNVDGLVYTWGDAQIFTGTPDAQFTNQYDIYSGVSGPNYADINLVGALVAYGADPGNFDDANPATGPGADGNGKISLHGMNANVTYDATKLVADPSSLPSGLPSVTRISYGFEN